MTISSQQIDVEAVADQKGVKRHHVKKQKLSVFQVLKQQPKSLLVCLFAALGGMLYGLDVGYIAPIMNMKSFKDDMGIPVDEDVPLGTENLLMDLFPLGAVVATLPFVSGLINDRFGRKWAILIGGVTYALGALLQATATGFAQLDVGRFLAGFAVGLTSTTVPVYQGEISPLEVRGALGTLYQLGITGGIFISNAIDFGLKDVENDGWRYCIYPQVAVGLILAIGMFFLPESPRLLVKKGKYEEAKKVITSLRKGAPAECPEDEYAQIVEDVEYEAKIGEATWKEMFSGFMLRLVLTGMALQFLQQLCGMNAFMIYGPKLFKMAGMNAWDFQLIQSAINFLATIPAIFLMDRVGRKTLLKWGAVGMCGGMIILGSVGEALIPTKDGDAINPVPEPVGTTIAVFGLLFVIAFAVTWGAVAWIYCAEMFPMKYRGKGVGMTTTTSWVGNFIVSQVTNTLIQSIGFGAFLFYAGWCVLCVALAWWIPETANVPLEDLVPVFEKKLKIKFRSRESSQAASADATPQAAAETKPAAQPESAAEMVPKPDKL